jgi:3-methyladenine DNA glycosylase AlkD
MPTAASILSTLKSKGKESTRKIYARHGMAADRVYGVSVADVKAVAKTIKGQQVLALELYATGIMDAMYLAGMVADGAKMSRDELNQWAEGAAQMQMIAEYTVPWVTVENPMGRELALEWLGSKKEHIASAGWCTYSGLAASKPDGALDLNEIESLLARVVRELAGKPNRVRYTMNGFVVAVGTYVKPLLKQAKAAARQIGVVEVSMGDTACKVPLAAEYIERAEAAGKIGLKKKTIRC